MSGGPRPADGQQNSKRDFFVEIFNRQSDGPLSRLLISLRPCEPFGACASWKRLRNGARNLPLHKRMLNTKSVTHHSKLEI